MPTRNFVLLNRSDHEAVQKRLHAVFAEWQKEWCVDDTHSVEISLCDKNDADAVSDVEWQVGGTVSTHLAVGVGLQRADAESLISVLVGHPVKTENRTAIIDDLRLAALRSLTAVLLNEANAIKPDDSIPWSITAPGKAIWERNKGFVIVRCRLHNIDIYAVLYPLVTDAYLRAVTTTYKRRGGLVPRQAALQSQTTTLKVHVGDAELLLPELASLAVGDVITLSRRLDEPTLVKLDSNTAICAGYLGTRGNRKAVQLTSLHTK